MEHTIMCTECNQSEAMTPEMMEKMCDCGHAMKEHGMGAEHMHCNTCSSADKCGACPCGHGMKSHKMEPAM